MSTREAKLMKLMQDHPRLSTRRYAELAVEQGLVEEIDAKELVLREVCKDVRKVARSSKSDPQNAFVSLMIGDEDGETEEVYAPAAAVTKDEAQRVLDDYGQRAEGLVKRAFIFRDYWNGAPFNYQLQFNWG